MRNNGKFRDWDEHKKLFYRLHKTKWLDKKVKWHLCGYENTSEHGRIAWNDFTNIWTCNKKYTKNIRLLAPVPPNTYGAFYDLLDISLASVIDNPFNRGKSELKIIESGAKKVPFIGSNCLTYNRTNANVDLCSNDDEWYESIKELTCDAQLRKELGEELHDYVRANYIIENENDKRLSIL
jgi:hypothetical protein